MKDCIYDAHIHFPVKTSEPYNRLKQELKTSGVSCFMLILNTQEEMELYWKHQKNFLEDGLKADVAVLLDPHKEKGWRDPYLRLDSMGITYSVKIHPRISNIELKDREVLVEKLSLLHFKTMIIDSWFYGPKLSNHIGSELAIYLSENLPDKNIVIAHSGGLRLLETMLLTRPLKNVFYDLSLMCQYFEGTSISCDLLHFIKYTRDRVMFGSDFPDFSIKSAVEATQTYCTKIGLTSEEKAWVFYDQAKTLYS